MGSGICDIYGYGVQEVAQVCYIFGLFNKQVLKNFKCGVYVKVSWIEAVQFVNTYTRKTVNVSRLAIEFYDDKFL